MKTAETFAELSYAQRMHVGAIVVKDDRIISIGYNGTPEGWDNTCETKEFMDQSAGEYLNVEEIEERWPYIETSESGKYLGRYRLKTKPEVMHAERNALDKLAKGHEGGQDATLFVTHSPCLECAKSIYVAGIKQVIYKHDYRSDDGIKFLNNCKVVVKKLED